VQDDKSRLQSTMSDKESVWQLVLEWQNMTDGWRSPMSKYRRRKRWVWRLLSFVFVLLLPWWLSAIMLIGWYSLKWLLKRSPVALNIVQHVAEFADHLPVGLRRAAGVPNAHPRLGTLRW
jgi:hypothetical protein